MNRKIEVDGNVTGVAYGYHEGKQGADKFLQKCSLVTLNQY